LCPITSSLEAIIASEIAEEAMAEEAMAEEAMAEEAMAEEAMVEEKAIAEAVPEAPKTVVLRRSANASACAHLTLGSLCTVRRGYPCGSKQT
jgi:hypothetical protein